MEKKQYEIHQRHHKTYVKSKGRYFKCPQCDNQFNTQAKLDVHTIQVHTEVTGTGSAKGSNNDLVVDESIVLAPGTMMTVYHCPVAGCNKKNYLDSKSVRTHCRRLHSLASDDLDVPGHEVEAQYICHIRGCGKLFVEAGQIDAHLKHHRTYVPTNGVFDCRCCPETFSRKEQLDQHTLNFHTYEGIVRVQEQQQQLQLQREQEQQQQSGGLQPPRPVRSYQDEVAPRVLGYQCSICMRKFLHVGTHSNHVTNSHKMPGLQPVEVEMKPRYTCRYPRCGKNFMTKAIYKSHQDRHLSGKSKKDMECFKCGKVFSQFKSLHQHVIQTHADVTPDEIAKLESSHAKCSVCNKMFRSQEVLKNHMRKHRQPEQEKKDQNLGDMKNIAVPQEASNAPEMSKKCNNCLTEFFDDVSLQNHVCEYHPNSASI